MKRLSPLLLVVVALAGCGAKQATPAKPRVYHDPKYKFSFSYPASWSVPKQGHQESIAGVATYVVPVSAPHNAARLEVTVDHQIIPFPPFQEGHEAPDPNGGPDVFHYHHARVSGWPAMEIKRYNGTTADGIFTIVNTHSLSYEIRMITANPPLSTGELHAYNTVMHSLKFPFS